MAGSSNANREYEQFVHLFHRYKVPIYDYVQAITGDHYIAEDITQDIFIKLWKKQGGLAHIENIEQYIYRMARNQSMDYFKRAALDTKMADELKRRMTANGNDVSNALDYKEAEALINHAVAALPPQRRSVYLLSRRQGLKLEEIAAQMDLSVNTVKNHLVRALREIREYLILHYPDTWIILLASCFLHFRSGGKS